MSRDVIMRKNTVMPFLPFLEKKKTLNNENYSEENPEGNDRGS